MNAWLESLTGLVLRDPGWLWLWLLLPGLWLLRRRQGEPAVRFAPSPLLEEPPLPRSLRRRLLFLPPLLQGLALALLVLAAARPVERVRLPDTRTGVDILLCLDVSSSMTALDMDPQRNRLELAKAAATRFVAGRPDDRIGLVRFARYPDLLCPPTLDHGTLAQFLAQLEPVEADGPEDMTGIGTAVARCAVVLRNSTAPSKVVVLLTDGEENVATAETPDEIGPGRAARICAELGIRVYAIAAGIGKRDRSGQWVPLNTDQVRELAETTGGAFYEARDARAIDAVYNTIDQLEKVEFQEPGYELEDRFLPFLLGALVLILGARLLAGTALEVLP